MDVFESGTEIQILFEWIHVSIALNKRATIILWRHFLLPKIHRGFLFGSPKDGGKKIVMAPSLIKIDL